MRFRRKLTIRTNVELVPLIDVVFQLIAFFMISTTFILTPGISLKLPGSTTSEPVIMSRLVITIVSRDEVYLNKQKMDVKTLDKTLSTLTQAERKGIKSVVVEGDERVPYSLMVEVLDVLRKNDFEAINLRTREVKEKD